MGVHHPGEFGFADLHELGSEGVWAVQDLVRSAAHALGLGLRGNGV